MRPASLVLFPPELRPRSWRRAAVLAAVIALHLSVLVLLLRQVISPPPASDRRLGALTMTLLPEQRAGPRHPRVQVRPKPTPTPSGGARAPIPPAPPPPPNAPPSRSQAWSSLIRITGDQFAAGDIGKLPAHARSGGDGGSAGDEGQAAASGATYNGERLYAADWQRRPTNAELQTYVPRSAPPEGYGLIACQTEPGFRVDNCHDLEESPGGSGFAGAVRKAAWQFRVMPPRVNGKPVLGAWVRIRIDYSEGVVGVR